MISISVSSTKIVGTHAGQITLDTESLKVAAAKDKRAEIFIDRLVQRSGRGKGRSYSLRRVRVFSIPIDTGLNKVSVCSTSIYAEHTPSTVEPRPVDPNVSMAKTSPSSILVWSECFTKGIDFPPWIWYRLISCPVISRTGFTGKVRPPISTS